MDQISETVAGLFTREPPFSVLTFTVAFLLLAASVRLWWIHWTLIPIVFFVAYWLIPNHSIAQEVIMISCAVFPFLCRDFRNEVSVYKGGIIWFSVTAILVALFLSTPEPVQMKEFIDFSESIQV